MSESENIEGYLQDLAHDHPNAPCPECKGKQIAETWGEGDFVIPVFCGACNATGYADGVPRPTSAPIRGGP